MTPNSKPKARTGIDGAAAKNAARVPMTWRERCFRRTATCTRGSSGQKAPIRTQHDKKHPSSGRRPTIGQVATHALGPAAVQRSDQQADIRPAP